MLDPQASHRLRLNTLIRLRWLAIVGQSAAVLIVAYWLRLPAAGQPLLRADRLLGLAQRRARAALSRPRTG